MGELRKGGCAGALSAGVNPPLDHAMFDSLRASGMLAPDGHCKTFDASANGYARGEGCVAFVLSRASDAEPREPMALCTGTAVN
jgi:acyl transferase domain-containing protein